MGSFILKNRFSDNSVLIESEFIDQYMAKANGEYVKVYLLLLRHLNQPGCSLSITGMADALEHTENDILRALKYWEREGLLSLEYDESGTVCGLEIGKHGKGLSEEPKKLPGTNIKPFKNRKELKQLLFVAEQYLGKTLSKTEVDTITYFYDTLGFSVDLTEYLIEYCVENGHKSIHYIQSVALAWSEEGISSVEQAKMSAGSHSKQNYAILNAFGIKGRAPAAVEAEYIKRWSSEYGLTLDIILEACNRTIAATHQPSFEYADTILKNWLSKGVKHFDDIAGIDLEHKKKAVTRKATKSEPRIQKDKFNNFEGRSYDMDDLERKLLNSN